MTIMRTFFLCVLLAIPSSAQDAAVLEKATELALQYTAKLPNFICTETINRFVKRKPADPWKAQDKLTLSVAFSEKGEQYKLQAINDTPTTKPFQNVGGYKSKGEFGSLLRRIFQKESATSFKWERSETLNGNPVQVYSYKIDKDHSKYSVTMSSLLKTYRDTFAMQGFIYIDPRSNQVMRFTVEAVGIPTDWPISATSSIVEYAFADIGGQQFLMPFTVEGKVVMKDKQTRNLIQFSDYRKFSSEATIDFESSPLEDSKPD